MEVEIYWGSSLPCLFVDTGKRMQQMVSRANVPRKTMPATRLTEPEQEELEWEESRWEQWKLESDARWEKRKLEWQQQSDARWERNRQLLRKIISESGGEVAEGKELSCVQEEDQQVDNVEFQKSTDFDGCEPSEVAADGVEHLINLRHEEIDMELEVCSNKVDCDSLVYNSPEDFPPESKDYPVQNSEEETEELDGVFDEMTQWNWTKMAVNGIDSEPYVLSSSLESKDDLGVEKSGKDSVEFGAQNQGILTLPTARENAQPKELVVSLPTPVYCNFASKWLLECDHKPKVKVKMKCRVNCVEFYSKFSHNCNSVSLGLLWRRASKLEAGISLVTSLYECDEQRNNSWRCEKLNIELKVEGFNLLGEEVIEVQGMKDIDDKCCSLIAVENLIMAVSEFDSAETLDRKLSELSNRENLKSDQCEKDLGANLDNLSSLIENERIWKGWEDNSSEFAKLTKEGNEVCKEVSVGEVICKRDAVAAMEAGAFKFADDMKEQGLSLEFICPIYVIMLTDPIVIASGQAHEDSNKRWLDGSFKEWPVIVAEVEDAIVAAADEVTAGNNTIHWLYWVPMSTIKMKLLDILANRVFDGGGMDGPFICMLHMGIFCYMLLHTLSVAYMSSQLCNDATWHRQVWRNSRTRSTLDFHCSLRTRNFIGGVLIATNWKVQWLSTLGNIAWNFNTLQMVFKLEGAVIKLKGEKWTSKEKQLNCLALYSQQELETEEDKDEFKLSSLMAASHEGVSFACYGTQKEELWPELDQLLLSFADIFEEPTELPPHKAATKKAGEEIAHTYNHIYGLFVTGLTFFTVYGPWGRPDMAYFFFTRDILKGKSIPIFEAANHETVVAGKSIGSGGKKKAHQLSDIGWLVSIWFPKPRVKMKLGKDKAREAWLRIPCGQGILRGMDCYDHKLKGKRNATQE